MIDFRKVRVVRRAFGEDSGASLKATRSSQKPTGVNRVDDDEIHAWARHALARNGFGDAG